MGWVLILATYCQLPLPLKLGFKVCKLGIWSNIQKFDYVTRFFLFVNLAAVSAPKNIEIPSDYSYNHIAARSEEEVSRLIGVEVDVAVLSDPESQENDR